MTEQEWLTCTDPQPMLEFLTGKASERKLRVFGAACCRHIWHLLPDERSRRAVEIAELYADGLGTDVEAQALWDTAAAEACRSQGIPVDVGWRAALAVQHLMPLPEESGMLESVWAYVASAMEGEQLVKEGATQEMLEFWDCQNVENGGTMGWTAINPNAILSPFLRDIFGLLPFRPASLDPAWLNWHDGLLVSMAQKMYDSRDFRDMPVLADALEEAGCQDQHLLAHCRSGSEHVRGCWVIDGILNKS